MILLPRAPIRSAVFAAEKMGEEQEFPLFPIGMKPNLIGFKALQGGIPSMANDRYTLLQLVEKYSRLLEEASSLQDRTRVYAETYLAFRDAGMSHLLISEAEFLSLPQKGSRSCNPRKLPTKRPQLKLLKKANG